MEIYIDNKKISVEKKKYKTLGLVMDEVNKILEKEGKLLYDICVNGEGLVDNQVILGESINLVEVTTRSPKLVIIRALQDMESFIERYVESIDLMLDENDGIDDGEALGALFELVGGLEWCQSVLYSIKENTAADFMIEDFDSKLEDFDVCLNMVQDALESRDLMTLIEILDYDMKDILDDTSKDLLVYQEIIMQEEVREGRYA